MNEKQLRLEIGGAIISVLEDRLWITKATPEQRRKYDAAIDRIIEIMKEAGFRPAETGMDVIHHPSRTLPEENIVRFSEHDYPGLVHEPEQRVDAFVPGVQEWLNTHASGWQVTWDRGDWGEGSLEVTLSLPSKEIVRAFVKQWGSP